MTTREAMELIEGAVLLDDGIPLGRTWADLGAGSGTFTFALAELLGPGGSVVAVDREAAALEALRQGILSRGSGQGGRARITPVQADFRTPGRIEAFGDSPLDGALFANALHFDPDPGGTLETVGALLGPEGRLVIVEYQDRPPNPWVPHPLPVAALQEVAEARGLGAPHIVGERPSSYGGFLYCAWLAVE